ncbi:nitroreductase family protein [Candidatus Chloroploca sp. M-50]|uniref:Nitroreductase family protein n=1 Tax=Candidatus Chloroploca mongolica TaxID=2528176 RepID=A0ABS4D9E0_9CHLR|nr:nitroreductase family protein [Candidatus Chloroploca mongolica]MBP1466035.1 nitroreductase family protein [Candidatus Chloroploca mongolica]
MEWLTLIRGRRSVRAFRPDPLTREQIELLLEAARWAPSPHGRQPWRFVVLTTPEAKLRLADAMGAEWRRQLSLDGQDAATIDLRFRKSHERITGAPVVIVPCLYLADLDVYPDAERQDAEHIMAIQSLGCAVQNLLLAAYAQGFDGGWMCAPLFCQATVRAALGLADDLAPHALIPLGYPARDPVRRPRRSLDELVVHWE